ncbi:sigma factor G inhibitor Gin [Clostridium celatum]|uniref:sigma factor G inhibitor Gin n=1 Tax=Clostridium celatum TaxID=36834 RepID=UPI00189AAFFB|nr:sigma factor G inhibitor Gin [Clostridium celatum]MCE9656809.1 sigma factor G inhibitor Gin [Clostridium celatum]MDU2266531.1 sigma factor G inhibitor Gin [Clostridium celatum]MDU6296871.1 sigma factor G inhibitor Gin [Clostridium celatum]
MEINNKDIWRGNKKYCIICEEELEGSGIDIMGYFICEECVKEINSISVNDNKYDLLKNKINETITKRILKIEEKE